MRYAPPCGRRFHGPQGDLADQTACRTFSTGHRRRSPSRIRRGQSGLGQSLVIAVRRACGSKESAPGNGQALAAKGSGNLQAVGVIGIERGIGDKEVPGAHLLQRPGFRATSSGGVQAHPAALDMGIRAIYAAEGASPFRLEVQNPPVQDRNGTGHPPAVSAVTAPDQGTGSRTVPPLLMIPGRAERAVPVSRASRRGTIYSPSPTTPKSAPSRDINSPGKMEKPLPPSTIGTPVQRLIESVRSYPGIKFSRPGYPRYRYSGWRGRSPPGLIPQGGLKALHPPAHSHPEYGPRAGALRFP